ncbi:Transmembrane protease serine 9 [Frankliniella fusca]|uniref:Transmembrane protease serine 9 n=1 Tax=Frankliniella fusca TaxID=407009 RepID=A0AAE1GXR1_9NEOP|nr:Transmembrane protease serine 9 [Frankliniella fusca]
MEKITTLKISLTKSREKLAKVPDKDIEKIVLSVPQGQQELVRNIFKCSKVSLKGRRYTIEWIYECLLMKIKGPALYRKLRRENKLPLPSPRTLNRFIRKLRPKWGFQEKYILTS